MLYSRPKGDSNLRWIACVAVMVCFGCKCADRLGIRYSAADWRRAAWVFGLAAILMASYYIFKSARDALFLHYYDVRKLPYAYLGSVGVALVATFAYNRALRRIPGRRLIYWVIGIPLGLQATYTYP